MAHREPFKIRNISSSFSNNSASTQVYFDNEKLTLEELIDIRREIREHLPVIPGAEIELGRQAGAESQTFISVNMYGDDNVRLQALAREARRRLMDRGDFNEIRAGNERAREEVQIVLKRDLAHATGSRPSQWRDCWASSSAAGRSGATARPREKWRSGCGCSPGTGKTCKT